MTRMRVFGVSLRKGKMEDVDACLAGKLRTLEACTFTFSVLLVLVDAGIRTSPVLLQAGIFLSGQTYLRNKEIVKENHFGSASTTWLPGQWEWVGEGGGCFCYLNFPCPPSGYRSCTSSPVRWFCDDGWGSPSLRLDTSSLNFINWLLGHNCPGWNRIAEVGSLLASPEWAIDVGVLGCPWQGSGPDQPHADLPCAASRSLSRACGSIPCSISLRRKVLP